MTLTEQDRQFMTRFRNWLIEVFGKEPPFDCRLHTDANGMLLVDAGRMVLTHQEGEWELWPIDQRVKIKAPSFELLMLEGLYYSLERAFINSDST